MRVYMMMKFKHQYLGLSMPLQTSSAKVCADFVVWMEMR
jgi:hypothetical protein